MKLLSPGNCYTMWLNPRRTSLGLPCFKQTQTKSIKYVFSLHFISLLLTQIHRFLFLRFHCIFYYISTINNKYNRYYVSNAKKFCLWRHLSFIQSHGVAEQWGTESEPGWSWFQSRSSFLFVCSFLYFLLKYS